MLCSWVQHRLSLYLDMLKRYLPRISEGGNLASMLEHCMVRTLACLCTCVCMHGARAKALRGVHAGALGHMCVSVCACMAPMLKHSVACTRVHLCVCVFTEVCVVCTRAQACLCGCCMCMYARMHLCVCKCLNA